MTPTPDADGQYRITMPSLPREHAKARLLQMLSTHHTGAACGIGAVPLANKVLVNERTLRSLISEAREEGIAIAGTPSTGYYIAKTAAELEACCQFLRSRAMHSLHIEAQLRRIPLADLVGQLRLPT